MSLTVVLSVALAVTVVALLAYMLAQKPVTTVQHLIQQRRYEEAAALPATDSAGHLHRAEALKLLGRFDEAADEYRLSSDPAAREGLALTLAHQRKDLEGAKQLMEQTVAAFPAIQEFQALALAYILLRKGDEDAALRLYRDHMELLETRFRDDYTDPDPLLAETLYLFGELTTAAGDRDRGLALRRQAAEWAPGSVWAQRVASV
ncbi:MAG TPA: hypothetical protein VFT12_03710 [Thermoanaerobaculia bacterium]|nr:hypothetical protein [Thermoanaerobaculia bacterium]